MQLFNLCAKKVLKLSEDSLTHTLILSSTLVYKLPDKRLRWEGLSTDIARFPKEKFENRHRGFEESIALL